MGLVRMTIKSVEPVRTKTGKTYWKIESEAGEIMSCWSQPLAESMKVGDVGDGDITEKGQFKNLTNWFKYVDDSAKPAKKTENVIEKPTPDVWEAKDRMGLGQTAVNCAATIAAAKIAQGQDLDIKDVMVASNTLYRHLISIKNGKVPVKQV